MPVFSLSRIYDAGKIKFSPECADIALEIGARSL